MGWKCSSSLQCIGIYGVGVIGGCTDRSFKDNACPFPLIGLTLSSDQFIAPNHQCVPRLTIRLEDPDHAVNRNIFSYIKNATICQDNTVCPYKDNTTCCSSGAGKTEILFHYGHAVPSAIVDLSAYYSSAGYSLPFSTTSSSKTSISTTSLSTASSVSEVLPSAASTPRTGSLTLKQPTPSVTSAPNSTDSGLSSSAKVGIGLGIPLGVSLLLCPAIIFLRRHRKKNTTLDIPETPPQSIGWPVTAEEIGGKSVPAEMNGLQPEPFEMNGGSPPAELENRRG